MSFSVDLYSLYFPLNRPNTESYITPKSLYKIALLTELVCRLKAELLKSLQSCCSVMLCNYLMAAVTTRAHTVLLYTVLFSTVMLMC